MKNDKYKITSKLLCALLVCVVLVPIFGSSVLAEGEDANYKELVEQRKAYIEEQYVDYFNGEFIGEFYYYWPLISPPLTVLLYTDVAKELTIVKDTALEGDIVMVDETWFAWGFGSGCLRSPELTKATEACSTYPYGVRESVSGLRECIQYFDITKEELLAGFKLMKENPDAIRPLLPMLSDEEYEMAKWKDGTFGETDWPEFVIEALFMEDDAMAHRLLTEPYAVYVPELGRVVETNELNYELYYNSTAPDHYVTFDRLKSYDLTSDAMGEFIEYQMRRLQNQDTPYARELADLAAARETQLKAAAKTGDGATSALWVVALALPALAVLVTVKRKRRI